MDLASESPERVKLMERKWREMANGIGAVVYP